MAMVSLLLQESENELWAQRNFPTAIHGLSPLLTMLVYHSHVFLFVCHGFLRFKHHFYHLPTFSISLFCSLIPIPFLCFRTFLSFTIPDSKQALNGGTRIEIVWFRYVQDDITFEDQLPHTYTCGQVRTQYVDIVVHNNLLVLRWVLQLKNLPAGY
jgi:hypothetical protein